jgi:hypothetical protein
MPSSSQDLPNPKKRAKPTPAATANTKATRTASRLKQQEIAPSTVLSPKSHNSRTLPRSPFKMGSSPEKEKPTAARAPSPIKHSNLAPPKQAASRPASRQVNSKRTAATATASDTEGRISEASNTSAGTTIVTKLGNAAKRVPAAAAAAVGKKSATAAGKTAAAERKAAAAKKENAPPAPVPAGGGRTLRKRG